MDMTEAMACRTPVITWPNGSVPEVVADGETSSIAGSVEEVAAAIDGLVLWTGDTARVKHRHHDPALS